MMFVPHREHRPPQYTMGIRSVIELITNNTKGSVEEEKNLQRCFKQPNGPCTPQEAQMGGIMTSVLLFAACVDPRRGAGASVT
jgi:hypothetical protein